MWKRGNIAWLLSHGSYELACAWQSLSGTIDALEGAGGWAVDTISHSVYSTKGRRERGSSVYNVVHWVNNRL